jgi:YegS/Rv2252/BmrU family lipid kinase
VNTASRSGKKLFHDAVLALKACGVSLLDAQAIAHPEQFAGAVSKAMAARARAVVVGGGDGTLSAAAQTLAHSRASLGVLPLGTANDFARSLGIPTDLKGACEVIRQGKSKRVDLGQVNGRYFLNAISLGFSGVVTKNLDHGLKAKVGKLAYAHAASKGLSQLAPFRVEFTTPKKQTALWAYQVVVGNGTQHGGGQPIAPDAELDDGQLDIYAVRAENNKKLVEWAALARFVARLQLGAHLDDARALHIRADKVTIKARPNQEIDCDGELVGKTPAEVSVCPKALRVLAPA